MIPPAQRTMTWAEVQPHPEAVFGRRFLIKVGGSEDEYWLQPDMGVASRDLAQIYTVLPEGLEPDDVIEILPDVDGIPPAVGEERIDNLTMLKASNPDHPNLHRRMIIRLFSEPKWATSPTDLSGNTRDRNEALVFNSFMDVGDELEQGRNLSFAEFLPDATERQADWVAFKRSTIQDMLNKDDSVRSAYERQVLNSPVRIKRNHASLWFQDHTHEIMTSIPSNAYVWPNYDATPGSTSSQWVYEVKLVKAAPDNRSELEKRFPKEFINMVKAAPGNEMIRGWILKVVRQLPPKECDTMEKLEEWLKTLATAAAGSPVKAPPFGFAAAVAFSERVSGHCRFSENRYGAGTFQFTGEEIREAVENGESLTAITEALADLIRENAEEQIEPDMEADGDFESPDLSNKEVDDHEGMCLDFSRSRISAELVRWITNNMPEARERIGL